MHAALSSPADACMAHVPTTIKKDRSKFEGVALTGEEGEEEGDW